MEDTGGGISSAYHSKKGKIPRSNGGRATVQKVPTESFAGKTFPTELENSKLRAKLPHAPGKLGSNAQIHHESSNPNL